MERMNTKCINVHRGVAHDTNAEIQIASTYNKKQPLKIYSHV
jgi:hypothetical protein